MLSENKYLRWENEQFSQNIESLNLQLNEKSLKINELQAEIHCLKINQVEINRLNALKYASTEDKQYILYLEFKHQSKRHEKKKGRSLKRRCVNMSRNTDKIIKMPL